jgi:hypothetical protein
VRARLHKIRTIARTIERSLALLAAALRANAPVKGGAKPLFLTDFTNGATQSVFVPPNHANLPQVTTLVRMAGPLHPYQASKAL